MKVVLRIILALVIVLAIAAAIVASIGATTPREHEVSARVDLERPPSEVLEIIRDVKNYPCWRTDVERVEIMQDDPLRFVEHVNGEAMAYAIDAAKPGEPMRVRVDDPNLPWGGTWEHVVEKNGKGTRLSTTERGYIDGMLFRGIAALVMDPHESIVTYHHDLLEYRSCPK